MRCTVLCASCQIHETILYVNSTIYSIIYSKTETVTFNLVHGPILISIKL